MDEVIELADHIFGGRAEADEWLDDSNPWNFGGVKPRELLATAEGREKVLNLLRCAQHGMLA